MQTFAIIPAAGRSSRMGQPKLLLPWGSTTVIGHVLSAWRASRVTRVVLVVHPLDHEIADIGRRLEATVVVPEVPPPEMKISVGLALDTIRTLFHPAASDAWLLAPADMPGIDAAAIDRLIDAYHRSVERAPAPRIWAPSVGGRRGYPVLFPWSLADEVTRLGPDEGVDAIVARNIVETIDLGQHSVLEDLDTPEDYERLRARHGA